MRFRSAISAVTGAAMLSVSLAFLIAAAPAARAQIDGGTLAPGDVDKYVAPLVIPPAMPRAGKVKVKGGKNIEYYEIALRQFNQYILPPSWSQANGVPPTTVWSYGAVQAPGTVAQGGSFNYPAFTIEAKWEKPVRVKWSNELVADPVGCFYTVPPVPGACDYLSHLLPVDQTLHWANPVGVCKDGSTGTDCRGTSPDQYTGPVPMVVHVHGAETTEWSDGYPEAWWLPDLTNNSLPTEIQFQSGSFFDTFRNSSPIGMDWTPGSAVFEYANDMRATTLWYHDHTLGMTRQNVYAGPAGFFLIRGGPADEVLDATTGLAATLPGPAPALGDPAGMSYYEIPIVIQDRSFNADGSLFYPDKRAFFEGLDPSQLQIPFIPDDVVYPDGTNTGPSDVSPVWNPEFFGNMMVVNGGTWPYLDVEQRQYRFRFLNGCQSRFLILRADNGMQFHQIGSEGGFLPQVVTLNDLLMGPAERADVIMDFSAVPVGTTITVLNLGPDEPFGGGTPYVDFEPSDPGSTGQVMTFRVVAAQGPDNSTPVANLVLPAITPLGPATSTRQISLNEEESQTVFVSEDVLGNIVLDLAGEAFGPTEALLGTVNPDGTGHGLKWSDATTENPDVGATEVWEIYNFTMDAHPIHIHLVQFQVVDRQGLFEDEDGSALAIPVGAARAPEAWETGFKDTVIAYPGEVTRVKARFDYEGLYVWHCHILEHEDNEMMRPYCVGNSDACVQHNGGD
jgi:FtsP/CotA-like multicopper oxidase with cupredoxin domain